MCLVIMHPVVVIVDSQQGVLDPILNVRMPGNENKQWHYEKRSGTAKERERSDH